MKKTCLLFFWILLLNACSETTVKPEKNLVKAPDLPEETILANGISTYDEGLFRISLNSWSELRDGYPTSYYSTLAELKIADANFFSGDYPAALVAYEEFTKLHPGHEAMPYVRYQIANCSFKQYKDVLHDQAPLQTALKSYEQLIEQYPKSEYVVLARRQIDRCKELQAAYEKYVADFYQRKGLDAAANSRIERLSERFPGSRAVEQIEDEGGKIKITSKKESTTSGKIPSAPTIVQHSLLNRSHYAESLKAIKERQIKLSTVVEEAPLPPLPLRASPVEQKELVDFICEENRQGAVFSITTLSKVLDSPIRVGRSLKFNWARNSDGLSRESQKEPCSALGLTVEAITNNTGLTLVLPSQAISNTKFIVLNRPNRVVLIVNSIE